MPTTILEAPDYDGDISSSGGWSAGLPDATTDATASDWGGYNSIQSATLTALSWNFSGYGSGSFTQAPGVYIISYGNVNFSGGAGTLDRVRFDASGLFTFTTGFNGGPLATNVFGARNAATVSLSRSFSILGGEYPGAIDFQDASTLDLTGDKDIRVGAGGILLGTGGLANAVGCTIETTGNFHSNGPLTGGTFDVSGTCTASKCTVTACDFSGGTALTVTNGIDGGSNTNVNFVYTDAIWDGSASTVWGDIPGAANANWDIGITPLPGNDVKITVAAPGDVGTATSDEMEIASLDCTGFIHQLITKDPEVVGNAFIVSGDFKLSAGMTLAYPPYLGVAVDGDCTLTTAGHAMWSVEVYTNATLTIGDNLSSDQLYSQSGVVIEWGTKAVVLGLAGTLSQPLYLDPATTINYSAGATLQFVATNPCELVANVSLLPPTTLTGASTIGMSAPATFESLVLNGPSIDPFGFTITTTGNCTFTAGDYSIVGEDTATLTVLGNFSTSVDLIAPVLLTLNVTGTSVAHNATITKVDASGGTELDATDNCVDGGGNINVNFGGDAGAVTRGFFAAAM